jgi:ABC-type Mn2+/Zn2+ transport system ATPase subunit
MIKLTLNNKFKSLEPFEVELPDFVVLTGINGAGKSQILFSAQNMMKIYSENQLLSNIKYVANQTLAPSNNSAVSNEQLNQISQSLWDDYSENIRHQLNIRPNKTIEDIFDSEDSRIRLVKSISKSAKKEVINLSAEDFYDHYPIFYGLQQTDLFSQNFSLLYKRYQIKLDDNQYRRYRNESLGKKEIAYISEDDFVKTYGEPPWDLVNSIFSQANLDYISNSPTSGNRDAPFEFKLINKHSKAEIRFGELSSGEKVIMSLALALYNSNFEFQFPEVLLMDEPDGSLHPSMAKQFLSVIENVFVKEKGVKVIISTHSPSTVALAPEEAIFIVNKFNQPRIVKSTKDKALSILTSGVPSFSVNYENRRQIFVESPDDVVFF